LEINFQRIRNNPGIKVITNATVKTVEGEAGNFSVTIERSPQYVNSNCTNCGDCVEVCPVERPDEFNYNLSKTKAIYLPHHLAFPFTHVIDQDVCITTECKKCQVACKYNAIDFSPESGDLKLEISSIVVATGWEPYDAGLIKTLHYSEFKNIITNVEFERYAADNGPGNGRITRPSDGELASTIAFAQCAGSRDENHLPYCSGVCCSASLKQALTFIDKNPKGHAKIFYIDLRVSGRNEDFLNKVEKEPRIELIRGKIARTKEIPGSSNIVVEAEDYQKGIKYSEEVEMLVLATGIKPVLPSFVEKSENDFNQSVAINGIYITGCAKRPLDVSASLKDATYASLKAIQNIKL